MSISEKHIGPALAVIAIVITLTVVRRRWGSKHLPYPPGPKGHPIIGNLLDLPGNPIWEGFAKMSEEYSE